MPQYFVADVGGTNIRLATIKDGKLDHIRKYLCANYPTLEDAIRAFQADVGNPSFSAGCIAIACPVGGDRIAMTNHHWSFSRKALQVQLKLDTLLVINDFTAIAMSVPGLRDDQVLKIGAGTAEEGGSMAIFGPGTGLGVSQLVPTEKGWLAVDGEGGHVDFAPVDEEDLVVWRFLRRSFEHSSAEEVLSGRGLVHTYLAFCQSEGVEATFDTPAQVTEAALAGSCPISERSLHQFCRMMGSFAGNLALTMGAFGGVFIAGGVVQHFLPFLKDSEFRNRFEAKGRFRGYVSAIPTFVITEPDHGLLGAKATLEQELQS